MNVADNAAIKNAVFVQSSLTSSQLSAMGQKIPSTDENELSGDQCQSKDFLFDMQSDGLILTYLDFEDHFTNSPRDMQSIFQHWNENDRRLENSSVCQLVGL